jgi:hypothetical protein
MANRFARAALTIGAWLAAGATVLAQPSGLALTPPMGWTTWTSLQTSLDEDTVKEIARIQAATLKHYGYVYVNVDGGWYQNPDAAIDEYGRWVADETTFPSGMAALGEYIHSLGLKFGIYVTPGIPSLAWVYNTPIEGTPYRAASIAIPTRRQDTYLGGTMFYIDYSVPGAQEFINSWANLFASWGVDYVKLDAVGEWNIPDIQAWSAALRQTGRPMYLALSNNLSPAHAATWRVNANSWRISPDIEAYNGHTLTTWAHVVDRFARLPLWLAAAGAGGWNDLDSVIVGTARSGLTPDERRTLMSLWALSAAPLVIGDDLRTLDDDAYGLSLLTNREVLAVNQSGVTAAPVDARSEGAVWVGRAADGSYAVGLFNLGEAPATVKVPWSSVGFSGSASVRDLWERRDVGVFATSFTAELQPHASMLLRVTPQSRALQSGVSEGTTTAWAYVGTSRVGARGQRAQYVGFGSSLAIPVTVTRGGSYELTITYINGDAAGRTSFVSVNGQTLAATFPGRGDWGDGAVVQGITTSVLLAAGRNEFVFWNPWAWAPDIVGISVQPADPQSPPAFKIVNASSGRVLDAALALDTSGAPIVQMPEGSAPAQQWQLAPAADGTIGLINRASGLALDLYAAVPLSGLPVVQRPYAAAGSQHWRAVASGRGTFIVVNPATGLVLSGSHEWNGAKVQQSFFSATPDQEWRLVPVM